MLSQRSIQREDVAHDGFAHELNDPNTLTSSLLARVITSRLFVLQFTLS